MSRPTRKSIVVTRKPESKEKKRSPHDCVTPEQKVKVGKYVAVNGTNSTLDCAAPFNIL